MQMKKVEIIGECGKNQITRKDITVSECLENAKKLTLEAKNSGASVIKWQAHVFEDEQKKRSEARYEWIKLNEALTPLKEFWEPLKAYHDELGVEMLVTGMSKMAAEKINPLVKRHKIGSADIVDFELLEFLKSTGKPIILSVGMSTTEQVNKALEFLGDQVQYILYCISVYPTPIYKIDLEKLVLMKSMYGDKIGFSDHSLSWEVPVLAVRAGAKIIEKHFCLSRDNNFGPDFKVSLQPDEFKKMVDLIRLAETEGESFEEERSYWKNFRKNN